MTNNRSLLERWAQVVEIVINNDGPEVDGVLEDDDGYLCLPRIVEGDKDYLDKQYNDHAVIAVLEKWLREDVAVWARKTANIHVEPPMNSQDHIERAELVCVCLEVG